MTDKTSNGPPGTIELKIPASSEWVRVARLTVAATASRLNFGFDDIEDIKLAVAEAINNAIQHAPIPKGGEAPPQVTIRVGVVGDGLQITISDEGHLTHALNVLDSKPRRGDDNLPDGGLGLLLIRSLMDEVSHVSGPNSNTTLSMVKHLPPRHTGGHPLGAPAPRR